MSATTIDDEIETLEARLAQLRATKSQAALLKAKEVADFLRIPLPTVYYLTKAGKLPSCQIGGRYRYRRADLERMIAAPEVALEVTA